ncbi:MAG: formate--tetrahydrofolate ligase, partial [Acidobacteriota bacterium]|nr:formate--tetrahydrofolate ligase [Acidobacteriota bacterium]
MPTDNEIARSAVTRPISEIAEGLSLTGEDIRLFGTDVAKVDPAVLRRPRPRKKPNRLILVSAMTPTKAGEGKTTTSIGLAQGLASLGESVCLALREPSLGPAFGMKGGATGGGRAQVVP